MSAAQSQACSMTELFGEVISEYSRAQTLADGVLIDVSYATKEVGIKYPVAMTASAYADCVSWSEADSKRKGTVNDERGRVHDVAVMLRYAIRHAVGGSELTFGVLRVPREGRGRAPQLVRLKSTCGPGDDMEPVITIDLAKE